MSRRKADRPVRWVATFVAVAVTSTIVALFIGLLALRFVGLSTYVVQGGPTESMVPIGSLVLVAPASPSRVVTTPDENSVEAEPAAPRGTAWVAIPTLGYAVNYAESYSPSILMGLVVWVLSMFVARVLAPYSSTARRRVAV
ncbi:MAG: hypothetical protein ABJB39_04165 [Chloroflexota bacterium]